MAVPQSSPSSRTFGENVKAARLAANMTQEDLAEALGWSRNGPVSVMERSRKVPKPATILRLAKALKTTPEVLMVGVVTDYDLLRGGVALDPKLLKEPPKVLESKAAKGKKRTA